MYGLPIKIIQNNPPLKKNILIQRKHNALKLKYMCENTCGTIIGIPRKYDK